MENIQVNNGQKKNFNPMLSFKIDGIEPYTDKYYLMHYHVYGHDQVLLTAMLPKGKASSLFGDDLSLLDTSQVYMMYCNGAYVNYITVRKGF